VHLHCSPFGIGNGNRYRKCSQLKFNKVKVSFMISANHAKAGKDSHILSSPLDGSRRAFHLRFGSLNDTAPANTVIYGSLNSGIRRSSASYGSFARRFLVSNKAKALAAHSKNRAANSDFSASKDVDTVTNREQLAGDGKDDVKLGSSISTSPVKNDNQNSKGSKKSKIRQSAGGASEEAVVAKGPESSFQGKRSSASKKGKESSQASEVRNY